MDSALLARILCDGLLLPPNLPANYRARHWLDATFIHGSLFALGTARTVNTSVWDQREDAPNAVPLIYRDDTLWIDTGADLVRCSPLDQPAAINEEVAPYGRIGHYLRFHTKTTVFATPIRECIFGAIGKPCQFCTYDMSKPNPLPADVFVDMFRRLSSEREVRALAIGPGTPNLRDHGVEYMSSLIRALRVHWAGGISTELVPPHDLNDLEKLVKLNVGSLIMSIEIWDDERRSALCPGKSYVSKAHYVEAWKKAVSLLGRGRVSSVLLVGLEDDASAIEGIDAMVELGVVPTMIPFRPYRDIPLTGVVAPAPSRYLALSRYNVRALQRAHIGPKMQVGCSECGGCSLEIERSLG